MSRSKWPEPFMSTCTHQKGSERVLECVPSKVTHEMNAFLVAPFQENEVKAALFQMFHTKASGPDGFSAHFSSVIGKCAARKS